MGFTSGLMGFERVIFMCFFVAFSRDLQWDFGIVLLDSKIWVGYFRVERGLRVRETRENRVCMFRGKVVFLGPNWWVLNVLDLTGIITNLRVGLWNLPNNLLINPLKTLTC